MDVRTNARSAACPVLESCGCARSLPTAAVSRGALPVSSMLFMRKRSWSSSDLGSAPKSLRDDMAQQPARRIAHADVHSRAVALGRKPYRTGGPHGTSFHAAPVDQRLGSSSVGTIELDRLPAGPATTRASARRPAYRRCARWPDCGTFSYWRYTRIPDRSGH